MARLKVVFLSVLVFAGALIAFIAGVTVIGEYWSYPFKPIPNSVRYMVTQSPYSDLTVRAYYFADEREECSAKVLWCEFYGKYHSPQVFYIEHNAKDNAMLKWIEPDGIEINGLALRLPGARYLWARQ